MQLPRLADERPPSRGLSSDSGGECPTPARRSAQRRRRTQPERRPGLRTPRGHDPLRASSSTREVGGRRAELVSTPGSRRHRRGGPEERDRTQAETRAEPNGRTRAIGRARRCRKAPDSNESGALQSLTRKRRSLDDRTSEARHLMIFVTRPAPTVRPPSRMANFSSSSMAIGWISCTVMSVLSPGITMSVPSGRFTTPVTSVVRK